ncbi:NAD(P)/FAD-dependent oxidoreductase [Desulfotalea psychrophila]|uniref:Related to NADH dehydrogenase n=1 Tax=Desulfotalea psychrophila (strain LSv54 / DSM 12343) TaxID=177439 RepID=Q6ANP3_DESPS|nr:FAD-dependent oxidoreductase [Desulfotalea psychrophila]CAG36031.1 related to NADH dehydrogenase [Desulfotalea psychrophila LSv54]
MKNLVLIGGGHAHMLTLSKLETFIAKGYRVTVIQPSDYHYYSGMGPGMLGGTYEADDIRFATKKQVEGKGGKFIRAHASRIDPEEQIVYLAESEEKVSYDILSCNAGSYVPKDIVEGDGANVFSAKPIEELSRAKETILEKLAEGAVSIAVLGGGPAAVEIAGNIHQLGKRRGGRQPQIRLFTGPNFMSAKPAKVQKLVRRLLLAKGIEIIEEGYVQRVADGQIRVADVSYKADIIFPAIGVRPSKIFSISGVDVGPDGGLKVNTFLQSTSHPNIFGGGDCIYFEEQPLDKVGVYAVRQNLLLYNNLMASLEEKPLEKFSSGGDYLLIYNLGDGEGVLSKWSITFSGRIAFALKDYIDRKFIKTFQEI